VTVKCRIGVDDQDPEAALDALTAACAPPASTPCGPCAKSLAAGPFAEGNREVPPLDYERAYRLKAANPDLLVAINGGIREPDEWVGHLAQLDGVMIGREAYQNPEILLQVDPLLFGEAAPVADAFAMLEALEPHIASISSAVDGCMPSRVISSGSSRASAARVCSAAILPSTVSAPKRDLPICARRRRMSRAMPAEAVAA
jgi:tRNA-dihydrouridine synthase